MASVLEARRSPDADHRSRSRSRVAGLLIAVVGLALGVVVLVNGIVAGALSGRAGEATSVGELTAWGFGLNSTALATAKVGIAVILVGVLVRLWLRVESAKVALAALRPQAEAAPITEGPIDTPYGRATVSTNVPGPLFIHRMARALWLPSLLMGYMAVLAGLIVSLVQTGKVGSDPALARSLSAWVQGLQFLGEGFVLSGIAFLLGTILASLRKGGGEVQASLGVAVKTLRMPTAAKLFVALMMLGMMGAILQFIVYVAAATFDDPTTVASYFAWLGPVREVSLGSILAGIVLALAAIARVLGFQFWRMRDIVATGR